MQIGSVKLGAKLSFQLCSAVAKPHGAKASFGGRNQHAAKRRRSDPECNVDARATAAVGTGSHPELLVRVFVEPAGRAKACFVECSSHIFPFAQPGFDLLHTPR